MVIRFFFGIRNGNFLQNRRRSFGGFASHPEDASLDPEESRDEGQHPKGGDEPAYDEGSQE